MRVFKFDKFINYLSQIYYQNIRFFKLNSVQYIFNQLKRTFNSWQVDHLMAQIKPN